MKGLIKKTNGEWFVEYKAEQAGENVWVNRLPLHPDDVKQIEEDSKVFDNMEARIATYPDVVFDIIEECCTPEGQVKRYADCIRCDKKIRYAELIYPMVSDDFQIGPEGAFEWEDDSISDEDIEKAACIALGYEYNNWVKIHSKDQSSLVYIEVTTWCKGANWYREQLKTK